MAKLGSYAVIGGIGLLLAWGSHKSAEDAAKLRETIVAKYSLDATQAEYYDGCIDALRNKVLKQGGEKGGFCGCVAKRIGAYSSDVKEGVRLFRSVADVAVTHDEAKVTKLIMSESGKNMNEMVSTLRAMSGCADEQAAEQQRVVVKAEGERAASKLNGEKALAKLCTERPQESVCKSR